MPTQYVYMFSDIGLTVPLEIPGYKLLFAKIEIYMMPKYWDLST